MFEYTRDVFYYETDKMGVVHHSNYIRWLEEARTKYFAQMGLPYEKTEEMGVLSPVIGLNVQFLHFARFGDTYTVRLRLIKYTGVRFTVKFTIVNQADVPLFEGESYHGFIGMDYRPLSLRRVMPQAHEKLQACVEPEVTEA